MDKGLTGSKWLMLLMMVCFCANAYGQIYKIVDKDGNVTYTDQAPGDGSKPMDLPELSVVTTDYEADQTSAAQAVPDPALAEEEENSPKALRKLYSDFHISRPAAEETFWGTENTVVVAWESSQPLKDGMSVRFSIDGVAQNASTENMLGITLDRGSHTVSAALFDASGRSIMTTETITFYVHQQTVRGNGP
jgi:hypothetical protein